MHQIKHILPEISVAATQNRAGFHIAKKKIVQYTYHKQLSK